MQCEKNLLNDTMVFNIENLVLKLDALTFACLRRMSLGIYKKAFLKIQIPKYLGSFCQELPVCYDLYCDKNKILV